MLPDRVLMRQNQKSLRHRDADSQLDLTERQAQRLMNLSLVNAP